MMLIETAQGIARELYLAPRVGDLHARQIGVVTGSIIVFAVAWALAKWIDVKARAAQMYVGAIWVLLTLTFEILVGRALGSSWDRIASDYDPSRGGWLLAGLAFMFFAPRIAAALRHRS